MMREIVQILMMNLKKEKNHLILFKNECLNCEKYSFENIVEIDSKGNKLLKVVDKNDINLLLSRLLNFYDIKDIINNSGDTTKLVVQLTGDTLKELNDGAFFNTNKNLQPKRNEDGSVDYKELNTISHIQKGDLLARLIKEDPGKSGKNVLGEEIRPRTVRVERLEFGNNITANEDRTEIYSDVINNFIDEKGLDERYKNLQKSTAATDTYLKNNYRKLFFILAIIYNVGQLLIFKYTDFFIQNINLLKLYILSIIKDKHYQKEKIILHAFQKKNLDRFLNNNLYINKKSIWAIGCYL